MRLRTVNTIFRKEILDTIRDKRTVIMMIGLPIVLYPAMLLIGLQTAIIQHQQLEAAVSRIAIKADKPQAIELWFDGIPKMKVAPSVDPEGDLARNEVDAVLVVRGDIERILDEGRTLIVEVLYDITEFASREAAVRIEGMLDTMSKSLLSERLARSGIEEHYIRPIEIRQRDVASPAKTTGTMLGLILPMLMVFMIALGAFYPAIDLTAGEKERGTFETLLSTPASKIEIVAGKFLTVFCLAMLTGILNLASMAATFVFMLSQISALLDDTVLLQMSLPFESFLIVLVVIIPLAFFICAMMMSVAVFARSFKEAQNYITPFVVVIAIPAAIAGFPGSRLTTATQFVPIANVVLLFKDLMKGHAGIEPVFAVFLSNAVYAGLALLFAAWLFQREEVVLSEERGIPLSFRRFSFSPRPTLTPASSLGLYAVILVAIFYLGSLVQQWHIISGLLITEWGLILLPTLLLLWFVRVDFKESCYLYRLSGINTAASILMALSCLVLTLQFGFLHNKVLPIPEDYHQFFKDFFARGETPGGFVTLLIAAALSPAICEEMLFRGAMLSGMRQRLGPWTSVLLIAILFGLFHISIYRIVPTALLGIMLGYLVLRTGSILAGMLAHGLVNATAILLASERIPPRLMEWLALEQVEQEGLPWEILVIAGIGAVAAIALVEISYAQKARQTV